MEKNNWDTKRSDSLRFASLCRFREIRFENLYAWFKDIVDIKDHFGRFEDVHYHFLTFVDFFWTFMDVRWTLFEISDILWDLGNLRKFRRIHEHWRTFLSFKDICWHCGHLWIILIAMDIFFLILDIFWNLRTCPHMSNV